ncbi:DNA/RNA polymerase [Meira miltonrushii]|uniref:DNA/RNA polymerase n=1 Tax=Meira miltonrushii TaxID=1280837 RepID=A0A316VCM9_9BASI|nr:DNA/RNA polymerase [Meira miltonrushii]PWN35389.1 DNA/RNA polymerase [Meira miltonrushii]
MSTFGLKKDQPSSTEQHPTRIIIALDLDAFYVAASRKRDPSLNGLPVAIKQKTICATTSYEARAKGVQKLMRIRDAVAKCPELIFVDGEDLSYFRKISTEIFKIVSSMVRDGLVEKLGMDELFCDVTSMVEDRYNEEIAGICPPVKPFGNVLPQRTKHRLEQKKGDLDEFDPLTRKLFIASNLAQTIRERVAEEVGLTSSAGIATSKCLAKLIGNLHKPNQQTVLAPCDPAFATQDTQELIDPFPIRKVNGFGSVTTARMCEVASSTTGVPENTVTPESMTILVARTLFDHTALSEMFGERIATRLHALLHGIDDEPVIKAPDFPAQISIEDSYFGLPFEKVPEQFVKLGDSLLRRLELELMSHPDPRQESEEEKVRKQEAEAEMVEVPLDIFGNPRSTWLRYPLSLRLTTRQGYTNRISRQTRMPVEIFDISVPRIERAKVLMHSCEALFRAVIQFEGNKGMGIHLINLAAIDLSVHRPNQSIGGFFKQPVQARTPVVESRQIIEEPIPETNQIDMAFLMELPEDVRREVAQEYGIELPTEANQSAGSQYEPLSQSSILSTQSSASTMLCSHCGLSMSSWLQHDHERWPDTGLPHKHKDEDMDDLDWDDEDDDVMSI